MNDTQRKTFCVNRKNIRQDGFMTHDMCGKYIMLGEGLCLLPHKRKAVGSFQGDKNQT